MKLNLKEIFCELLSGLALILLILPLLHILGAVTIFQVKELALESLDGTLLITLTLICSFVLGIIMDSIGLALGSLFIDKVICSDEPESFDYRRYWKTVTTELSAYREEQWAYYSCYRNMSIVLIPLVFFWSIVIYEQGNYLLIVVLIVVGVLTELALIKSMKILLELVYKLTKYDLSDSPPDQSSSQNPDDKTTPPSNSLPDS
ncbi:MAG: hypothetical protein HEP71_02910 [Roseivirga sp.]|nr:hypothetical protein [Roseivirga sp.]